jgi:hypothetical protein
LSWFHRGTAEQVVRKLGTVSILGLIDLLAQERWMLESGRKEEYQGTKEIRRKICIYCPI